jgi:hypothetical protein
MNRASILRFGVAIVGFALFSGVTSVIGSVSQQTSDGRSLRWDRFDVTIDNIHTSANQFDVTESYVLTIERGPYSYGFAEIPKGRLTGIDTVAVYDGDARLNSSCINTAGSVCVTEDGDNLSINYYFRRPAGNGEQRQIRIEYTVHGALRSYDEGDELFWVALPEDTSGFDVEASQVTVVMPAGVTPLRWTSYPDTWTLSAEGNTLTWDSPPRPSDDGSFEVRVKYPHDPAMKKPSWQTGYDLEQSYRDNLRPIVTLLIGAFSVLLTLGGILFIVVRYLRHGRDPAAVTAPEYLTEPPSDESPGIVGLLLDEKADMRDVMATFVDLARRGYFVIEQTEEKKLGLFSDTDFEFHRTEQPWTDLKSFEEKMIVGVFPGARTDTKLGQLKEKFYAVIPGIQKAMYSYLVKAGYFTKSPDSTRNTWIALGVGGVIAAAVLFWLSRSATLISSLVFLPPIGLGIVSAVALLFAESMPAKTEMGAQQAALWRAFRRYLQNIERYRGDAPADEQFEKYLPYATAFGIEKEFVREISPVLTTMPRWYHPTYLGGPWHGGYRGRMATGGPSSGSGIDLPGRFSPGGLDSMNRSLGEGLNSMSRGLTQVLNETSRVMTSRPKSSGSGGRGGFSGGGRGGGSGGGSRGFG